MITPPISLFPKLFPFHFAVDRELRVLQMGPSLERLCPELSEGTLPEHLALERPLGRFDADSLTGSAGELFVFFHKQKKFRLRGDVVLVEAGMLFLVSLWPTEGSDLADLGLTLSDFAPHDPAIEFTFLLQNLRVAYEDQKLLAQRLKQQRKELQEANNALHERNEQVERSRVLQASIFATAPDGILIVDPEGLIETANASAERMLGFPPGRLHGAPLNLVLPTIPHGDPAGLRVRHETFARRLEEGYLPVEYSVGRVADPEFPVSVVMLRDLTDRLAADASRDAWVATLHAALEATADGIVVESVEGPMPFANDRFHSMWSIPPEMRGVLHRDTWQQHAASLVADPADFLARCHEHDSNFGQEVADVIALADGRIIEQYAFPQRSAGRLISGRVWSYRDVTDRWRVLHASRSLRPQPATTAR